jgi:hypothetical protein
VEVSTYGQATPRSACPGGKQPYRFQRRVVIYQSTNGGTSYSVLYDTNFRGPTGVLRDPSIVKGGSTYFVAFVAVMDHQLDLFRGRP